MSDRFSSRDAVGPEFGAGIDGTSVTARPGGAGRAGTEIAAGSRVAGRGDDEGVDMAGAVTGGAPAMARAEEGGGAGAEVAAGAARQGGGEGADMTRTGIGGGSVGTGGGTKGVAGVEAAPEAGAAVEAGPVARDLLAWYDAHARDLPWRIPPGSGARADPYRVWLSEVMLQQTTVAAVRGYFARFTERWPDVAALAAAEEAEVMAEWAGLGYYARARNLMACARQVAAAGGFPDTRAALQALPGVGDYTSAAIAAIAFDRAETVVDGNVERVVARLFAVMAPLPGARRVLRELAARLTPDRRPGDFAQAMMDLGATICTPRNPSCLLCPLRAHCAAHARGLAAELPHRQPRAARPHREGLVWVLRNPAGDVLTERRPKSGLLGGMLAFPSTGWDGATTPPPADLPWQEAGSVSHVFTHFSTRLTVLTAEAAVNPRRGTWTPAADFAPDALPGLFRKVWTVASA